MLQELLLLLVVGGVVTVGVLGYLRVASDDAEDTLAELYEAAGVRVVRVPAEAQTWIRAEVVRRERWVGSGFVLGFMAGGLANGTMEAFLPWGLVSFIFGATVGVLAGTLISALRMRPFTEGAMRTVSLRPRRLKDHLTSRDYVANFAGFGLASVALTLGLLAMWGAPVTGASRMAVVGSLGIMLTLASVWTQRLLVARPRLAAAPEDRFWQEHLLAFLLSELVNRAFAAGLVTAAASAFVVLTQPSPTWLKASGIIALGLIVVAVAYLRRPRPEQERPRVLAALEVPA